MATTGLEDELQSLAVSKGDHLPFRPPLDKQAEEKECDEIPRYLFRVFTPRSQGVNNSACFKSVAASQGTAHSEVDLFAKADSRETAQMIDRHLRWQKDENDNLVSWTSSLLYALVYIFHLRAKERDILGCEQIKLCVIDTSTLHTGVFIRDLDLVRRYRSYSPELRDFEVLRLKKRRWYSGHYYFGEWLSQGALKVAGSCQVVSAQALIDQGLCNIRSEFKKFAAWPSEATPPWANPVVELRESFYRSKNERQAISDKALRASIEISRLFEPRWRLAVAANLIALATPRVDDGAFLAFLRPDADTAFGRTAHSHLRLPAAAHDMLPEVQEADIIVKSAYRDYYCRKLIETAINAEVSLREGITFLLNEEDNEENALQAEQGFNPSDVDRKRLFGKLDTVQALCDSLKSMVGGVDGRDRLGNK